MPHHGFIPSSQEELLRHRVKGEIRKRMRGLRQTAPADACAARSARIAERLLALPSLAGATSVALFWPLVERHEVDLRAVDAALRARGVRVAYPAADVDTGALAFRFVDAPEAMIEAAFGVREPPPGAEEAA